MDQQQQEGYAQIDFPGIVNLVQTGKVDGREVWSRLDDAERQQYLAALKQWSAGKGEASREDASVLGMPPELAAVSVAPTAMKMLGGIGAAISGLLGKGAGAAEEGPSNLLRMPKNVDTRTMMSDTMEQVGRGVQNDFRGPVHFQRPGEATPLSVPGGIKSAKFAEADKGADALDSILQATGRERPLGAAGQGTYKGPEGIAEGIQRKLKESDIGPFQRSEKDIEQWMAEHEMQPGQFQEQLRASVKKTKRRTPK